MTRDDPGLTVVENSTHHRSRGLARVLAVLVALHLILAIGLLNSSFVKETSLPLWILGATWLVWWVTFALNFRLIDSGTVEVRFRKAPLWVNRPSLPFRLVMHVLVNWSTVAMTVLTAWALDGDPVSEPLAWLAIGAGVAVWIGFNYRHRQKNHVRNLTLSTAFLVTIVVSCLPLLRGSGQ